jgi:hypothetical protein
LVAVPPPGDPGVLGVPGAGGGGLVEGDADGGRSRERSPTRSERESLQPARAVSPTVRAAMPITNVFMSTVLLS